MMVEGEKGIRGTSWEVHADAKIDIVIPVYNSPEWVAPCISAVLNNTDVAYNLIIVNDQSDDFTLQVISDLIEDRSHCTLLHNEKNLGFVQSANAGLRVGDSDIVVILNSDALVPPQWASRVVKTFEVDPTIGIVNPLSNEAANLSIPLAPGAHYLGQDNSFYQASPDYPDIVTAVGFCMAMKREMLHETGLFDEVFGRGYCEETDLCLRAMKAGWRVVACDNLYVFHRGEASFSERKELFQKNLRIFLKRHEAAFNKALAQFNKADPLGKIRKSVSEKPGSRGEVALLTLKTVFRDLAGLHPKRALRHLREGQSNAGSICLNPGKFRKFWYQGRPRVTFLLESMQPFGGVLSLIPIANRLIIDGIDVCFAALTGGKGLIRGSFFQPFFFGTADRLVREIPESDIFISVPWVSATWLPHIRKRFPAAQYISYLQDYEAYFLPKFALEKNRIYNSYAYPDSLITTSTWLRDLVREKHGRESVVIPKGVDTYVYRPGAESLVERKSVLAMARPSSTYRGYRQLVQIYEQLERQRPDIELGVFGCGREEASGLSSKVVVHGKVENGKELAQLYTRYGVVIDPSDFQGFGMVGLEAMACARPTVLTSIGGINEYARDGVNCLSADPENAESFVEKICTIIDTPILYDALSAHSRHTANEFSVDKEAARFREYLLGSNRSQDS